MPSPPPTSPDAIPAAAPRQAATSDDLRSAGERDTLERLGELTSELGLRPPTEAEATRLRRHVSEARKACERRMANLPADVRIGSPAWWLAKGQLEFQIAADHEAGEGRMLVREQDVSTAQKERALDLGFHLWALEGHGVRGVVCVPTEAHAAFEEARQRHDQSVLEARQSFERVLGRPLPAGR